MTQETDSQRLEQGQEQGQGQGQEQQTQVNPTHRSNTKITCLVNLKRHSLNVEYLEETNRLRISFRTDLLVNCVAQAFFLFTEDPRNGAKLFTSLPRQEPSKVVKLTKGLHQSFPPTYLKAEDVASFDVQLDEYNEDELVRQMGKTYPLLIRLVAMKPHHRSYRQNSLSEVNPAGPLPQWVQAQTTYAVFGKSDGKWSAEVIRQKLWIEGKAYELQEIYGMDHVGWAGNPQGEDAELEGQECVVCLSALRDTTVLPCRHLCMCSECARELQRMSKVCPVCRQKVKSLLHIKLGGHKSKAVPA
eukprot:TRINITY_DN7262_c1_g1_i4.p1 TRINITY_DN7262_c1_g1~~TRINITY_DN7262_c1_g1_i4.p1  ORF type:complete len:355 (-),score=46.46 TRINITY_DN7262_c1_g1_i4:388-1293(-)